MGSFSPPPIPGPPGPVFSPILYRNFRSWALGPLYTISEANARAGMAGFGFRYTPSSSRLLVTMQLYMSSQAGARTQTTTAATELCWGTGASPGILVPETGNILSARHFLQLPVTTFPPSLLCILSGLILTAVPGTPIWIDPYIQTTGASPAPGAQFSVFQIEIIEL